MLRGKRAVITGGGTGFGQALSVWLAREGVEVDFCARRADDIQKTCSIITAEGGMAKGHLCDLTLPESLSQFSSQLLTLDKPIDILGNDSNLLIVFYVQIMPDDFVMQLHRF